MNLTVSENSKENKSYGIGLDVIRIIAMFFVLMLHSTSFNGFESEGIHSLVTAIAGAGRYLSYSCVPLFLLLTGYLNVNKKPELAYYLKLIKILIEFYVCAFAVALFYTVYNNDGASFFRMMGKASILVFPHFSWYMRMYIGLYLLAPFFNYIIDSISMRQALLLAVISVILFSNPFIIDFWQWGYPMLYYFIGAIIRKTRFKAKKLYGIIVIPIACALGALLFKYPKVPRFNIENYHNIICVIISVSLFLLLYDIKCDPAHKSNKVLVKITRMIADVSMSTYLVSIIFETLTGRLFAKTTLVTYTEKFPYLLYLTPIKFVLSVICALLIHLISGYIIKLVMPIIDNAVLKIVKRKEQ